MLCIDRNGNITGFTIQGGQVNGRLDTATINGMYSNYYTFDNLLPYTDYRFRIAAVNANGTGPFSEFTLATTEEDSK